MYNEMMDTIGLVNTVDPELAAAMDRELNRQRQNIELIASENIVSPAVMAAMGSILTNKYAEGLPGKRCYGGCVYVDEVENIAIQRACQLFGAKYANVQPHSGAQANLAVYFALLELGDTVMGMDLSQGGHLTHGSPVNMSGKNYHFISYGVGADGVIDYAELEKQVRKVRPKMLVAGASAYPRAIDFEKLAEIAHGYGAYLMVDMAHIAGLVAGGQHQSPVPYADVVTTTTHKTLRGPRGGLIRMRLIEEDGSVLFTIDNEGKSIPDEDKSRIFNKFYQGDSSHESEGNGLGLALVRKIVAIHGGEVWVEDPVNGGCRFAVRLPVEK